MNATKRRGIHEQVRNLKQKWHPSLTYGAYMTWLWQQGDGTGVCMSQLTVRMVMSKLY